MMPQLKFNQRDIKPRDFTIVKDPGHGAKGPGTCSEKDSQGKKLCFQLA